jgi:predicted PurR-regulated permease PerM
LVDKGLIEPSIEKDSTTSLKKAIADDKLNLEIVQLDSIIKSQGDSSSANITLIFNINNQKDDELAGTTLAVAHTDDFFERAKKNILQFLNPARITGLFGSIVGFLGNLLITVLSVLFISFFFLKEQGLFTRIVKGVVPNQYEDQSVHAIDQSAKLLIRYFIGIAVQIVVITIYVSTALSFLGFKNALLIAFFAALMNVIPYVGPILGATFGLIITVSSNLDVSFYNILLPKILKLVAVFASMQLFDNFILQPNIFSKSVKAHPLEIFIVVLMGAKLGGVIGMILAIPAYTVLRVLAKVFLSEFKVVQRITEGI